MTVWSKIARLSTRYLFTFDLKTTIDSIYEGKQMLIMCSSLWLFSLWTSKLFGTDFHRIGWLAHSRGSGCSITKWVGQDAGGVSSYFVSSAIWIKMFLTHRHAARDDIRHGAARPTALREDPTTVSKGAGVSNASRRQVASWLLQEGILAVE